MKIGRKSLGKKEKKTGPKKKERVPFCQEKKKNPSLKWLGELHAGVQISNKEVAAKPRFAIHEGHYCVVLLNASLSDREKKKKGAWMGYFSHEIFIIVIDARRSRCPISLRFQEAR